MTETKKTTAKAASPAPAAKPDSSVSRQKALGLPEEPYFVQGKEDRDTVRLSSIVFKNLYAKNTLSVLQLQRRLEEYGYVTSDAGGWFGDTTQQAVLNYQADHGLPETGEVDATTLKSIFEDDPNVVLDFG